MSKKRLVVSAIMQCIIYVLFLLYGMFIFDLFHWIGSTFSIEYSKLVLALYILIGVLCISVPIIITNIIYKPSVLSDFVTLPIIILLSIFIHPDGVYGLMPTHFFRPVADLCIATGITVQIVVVELLTSGIWMLIYKFKRKHKK